MQNIKCLGVAGSFSMSARDLEIGYFASHGALFNSLVTNLDIVQFLPIK